MTSTTYHRANSLPLRHEQFFSMVRAARWIQTVSYSMIVLIHVAPEKIIEKSAWKLVKDSSPIVRKYNKEYKDAIKTLLLILPKSQFLLKAAVPKRTQGSITR